VEHIARSGQTGSLKDPLPAFLSGFTYV
jgi:hypothetical protein